MSRLNWIIFALIALVSTIMVFVNKTAHSELKPYLGKWNGGFEVFSIPGTENPRLYKLNSLKGFVVLYAANMKFDLELSGEQQDITVTGTWKILRKGRVELSGKKIKIDDYGGDLKRDPNKPYIPNQDVTAAYSKPIILDLSKDGQRFTGLLISVGVLEGTHRFDRVGSGT
jgi:hypothetical protein